MAKVKIAAALITGLALATAQLGAYAADSDVAFQPRPKGAVATGYVDVKKDATHYVVVYSAADEQKAKDFMLLRAAQIGQGAGFTHFVVTNSGTRTLRITQSEFLDNHGIYEHGMDRSGRPLVPWDYIPQTIETGVQKFYDVWAEVNYLTADQARGQANAVEVSQVLAAHDQ